MNKSYKDYALGSFLSLTLLLLSTPLFAVDSYDLPSGEWRQISLPLDAGNTNNTVRAIFEDDIPAIDGNAAEYGVHWILYAYDSAAGAYVLKGLNDVLDQGVGYWITQITGSPAQLDMPDGSVAGPDPFSIPLVAPAEGGTPQWNMVGHPLGVSINFSDYKIITSAGDCSGLGCDPTQAQEKGVFHNEIWRYSGAAYEKISGDTPLNPWDGYWCAALVESSGKNPQIIVASATLQPPIAGNWNLSFQEEFDGNSLSPSKWRVGGHHLGIAGNAANSSDQVVVQDGNLKLTAKETPFTFAGQSYDYVSGEISTFQQFRQLYGYFEARIKYDVEQGVWPAFWTMPDRGGYGNENWAHESFMRFDLDGISQPVTSALLKVKVTGFEADPYSSTNELINITVHKVLSNDWTEQEVTWNTKPAYDPIWLHQFPLKRPAANAAQLAGADTSLGNSGYSEAEYNQAQIDSNKNTFYSQESSLQAVATVSSAESIQSFEEISVGQELVIDVTGYINNQVTTNQATAEFALVDTFMRVHKISLGSKEAVDPADRPQLVINNGLPLNPTADAYVQSGPSNVNTNFGNNAQLMIQDPWSQTSSTKDSHGNGMEIDIMESLGIWGSDKTQHGLHWNGYGAGHQHVNSGQVPIVSSADGYHTYGMNWQPGRIDFYIDGIKSGWEFVDGRTGDIDSYILLSHQLGGWDGNVVPVNFLPATMYVDHVRVWSGSPSP